jgi:K+-transporting ATPase KdpF subunit
MVTCLDDRAGEALAVVKLGRGLAAEHGLRAIYLLVHLVFALIQPERF